MSGERPPRFLADEMLRRLARWLRVLGYDTAWECGLSDDELLLWAEREGRLLLTRDTLLVQRRAVHRGDVTAHLIRHDHLHDQLVQLRAELGIRRVAGPRCLVCNGRLRPIALESAAPRVPPYVAATQTAFRYCASCDRVVWPGTHWDTMLRTLQDAGVPTVGGWAWGV